MRPIHTESFTRTLVTSLQLVLLFLGLNLQPTFAQQQNSGTCPPTLESGLSYQVYNYDAHYQVTPADIGQFAFVLEAPTAEGLVESRWYGWSEEAGKLEIAEDGQTATLTGTLVSIDEKSFRGEFPGNPELKFEVYVEFTLKYNSALDYLREMEVNVHHPTQLMGSLGRYIKIPWQYTEEVVAHLENMQLWDVNGETSTLVSTGSLCSGSVLKLSRRTDAVGERYYAQSGMYGNDKNGSFGLACWIYTEGELCGNALREEPMPFTGDMNLDLKCPEEELISLPVTLTGFNATASKSEVTLNWSTANELNNDHFVLERSGNGRDFVALSEHQGKGTTSTTTHYQAVDRSPLIGQSYYRLAQYDFDGTQTYSQIIAVEWGDDQAVARLFPNPASGTQAITLSLSNWNTQSPVRLQLLNVQGQVLQTQYLQPDEAGHVQTQLGKGLPGGVYQVVLLSQHQQYTQGLIIQ